MTLSEILHDLGTLEPSSIKTQTQRFALLKRCAMSLNLSCNQLIDLQREMIEQTHKQYKGKTLSENLKRKIALINRSLATSRRIYHENLAARKITSERRNTKSFRVA